MPAIALSNSMFKRLFRSYPKPTAKQERYQHPRLGEITLNHSGRACRLSISVRPNGSVRLTIPPGQNLNKALRFLDEKSDWIERARTRQMQRHAQHPIAPPFSTRHHTLQLYPDNNAKIRIRISQGVIAIHHPSSLPYDSKEVQEAIHKGIEEAWRIEAQNYLHDRTDHIAKQLGLQYGTVTIRNTRSRWGSCSVRNDISLSLHLMKLPDILIDYVIIHELCHTIHKNHGPQFHQLLDHLTGGKDRELRRQLKTYSTRW